MIDTGRNRINQSVLITGCSSGIGQCLAFGLNRRGYNVIATCRNSSDCDYLNGNGVYAIPLDLESSTSIHQAVEQALAHAEGSIFGLINNGAYGQPGAVEDLTRNSLVRQFETNVFGTQELTNLIIPGMKHAGRGRIIQISSVLGFVCLKYRGAYNASKYALEALSDTLRLELMNSGVKVSLVEPGPIDSRFRDNAYKQFVSNINRKDSDYQDQYNAVEARLLSENPVDFMLPPESVLRVVKHALSSENPKIRYRVTVPTKIFSALKRLLPDRMMDYVLSMNR